MPDLRAPEWTLGRMDDLRKSLRAAHEGSSLVPMAIPSPPLCLSHTHSPLLRLSPPPSTQTHTHTRCSSGRSLLLIHTASLYLNPLSRLCRHLPPGVRGAAECYILDTLCCCVVVLHTHTRTDAQADIFCLIMTAEMRRSSSTIAVSVK